MGRDVATRDAQNENRRNRPAQSRRGCLDAEHSLYKKARGAQEERGLRQAGKRRNDPRRRDDRLRLEGDIQGMETKLFVVAIGGPWFGLRSGGIRPTGAALANRSPLRNAGAQIHSGRRSFTETRSCDNGRGRATARGANALNAARPIGISRHRCSRRRCLTNRRKDPDERQNGDPRESEMWDEVRHRKTVSERPDR